MFNAEHFTTLWKEYIRLFDEKAEILTVQFGPEVLFAEVAVCGNCHALCKKLENLLKTLFVPRAHTAEATLHQTLHAQEDYLPPPEPSTPGASTSARTRSAASAKKDARPSSARTRRTAAAAAAAARSRASRNWWGILCTLTN